MIGEVDGFIAGLDHIDAEVIQAAHRLRVIARYGVGTDRVDLEAATRRGIVVANTPGANTAAVAELAIGLMLALARGIPQGNQAVRKGEFPRFKGIGLRGKTVGLVGCGAIGQAVAARLLAFGCRVLAHDPYITIAPPGVALASLDELLPAADIVSLHAALTPETQDLVNQAFLARMKAGSLLVNTARGELVDEDALVEALASGRLRGAALDCLRVEPPEAHHPLLAFSQVIATPHSGSQTDEATQAMGEMALQACLAALRGERPPHVVNPLVYTQGASPR
jgi:D-3-phosphoglycerate dehydrogenase